MRKFDSNGLHLANYQAQIFELSHDLECSSKIFIRRFLNSQLLKILDSNDSSKVSLIAQEGIDSIEEQFGKSTYGTKKYSKEVLFWTGYMYRYISYTRDTETRIIAKLFPIEKMNELYYVFHTQDEEWCIRNMLEIAHIDENYFDKNWRLKQIIKRAWGINTSKLNDTTI